MRIILQINKILDDTVRLLDDVPWYLYLFVLLVIILLILIKPFIKYNNKLNKVKNINSPEIKFQDIDRKVFVKANQRYLAKNEVELVIKNVIKFAELANDSALQKNAVHLSSRFYEEKRNTNLGIKALSDSISMNQIKLSLIELLESIIKENE